MSIVGVVGLACSVAGAALDAYRTYQEYQTRQNAVAPTPEAAGMMTNPVSANVALANDNIQNISNQNQKDSPELNLSKLGVTGGENVKPGTSVSPTGKTFDGPPFSPSR